MDGRLKPKNYRQLYNLLSGDKNKKDGISNVEVERLSFLGSQVPEGGNVVEIGSHRGKSICCIASGVKAAGKSANIFCIDLWTAGEGKTFDHYSSGETWRIFNEQIKRCKVDDLIRPIQMASIKAAAKRRRPIHLLFIDAGHKYKDVLADCLAWQGFVPSGGVIAFHDFGTRFPGVDKVINEKIIASGSWEDYEVHGRIWSARRK